jgi:cytochrome c oxidase subunit 3
VFLTLACDMVFFLALVVVFYASRSSTHMNPRSHEWIGDWHPVQLPPILFLNTALLLLSSLTMERARQTIFNEIDVLEEWLGLGRPALRRTLPWVAATLVLGSLFLIGQVTAWRQLTAQGFAFDRWSTPSSYFFYVITGVHAIHLLAGVAALILCLVALNSLKRVQYRQIAVDTTAWYWHTMGLAWLLLLAVLALG